jgi:hypothetical protein
MTPAPSSASSGKEEGEEKGQTKTNTFATTESAYANEYYTRMVPSSCDWSEENIVAVGCDAGPFVLLIVSCCSFFSNSRSSSSSSSCYYYNSADLDLCGFLLLYANTESRANQRG